MAFIDGAGSVTFSGPRWSASGAVAVYDAVLISPTTGTVTPSLGVPLQVLVDNSLGGTSDVQIYVATDAAFANIIWPGSLSAVVNGIYTVQPTGLAANTWYYWRARIAPAGTTNWGPWATTRTFYVDVNAGRAWGYSYENVGVEPGLWYSGGNEYVYENAGVEITLYAGIEEYVYANLGVEITLTSQAVEYVYEGDVNDLTPVPHVWFVYKPFGFATDTVYIYGQGFGALQSQYNGQPKLDWGPDFGIADISMGAESWVIQPANADSYGPDRQIHAGTSLSDPPFTNVETDIIEVTIPEGALPSEADGPQDDLIYIVTTGGTSNKVLFLYYPTIPIEMGIPILSLHSAMMLRVVADPVSDGRIAQPFMVITAVPYIVAGGSAQRDPLLGAISKTSAQLGV